MPNNYNTSRLVEFQTELFHCFEILLIFGRLTEFSNNSLLMKSNYFKLFLCFSFITSFAVTCSTEEKNYLPDSSPFNRDEIRQIVYPINAFDNFIEDDDAIGIIYSKKLIQFKAGEAVSEGITTNEMHKYTAYLPSQDFLSTSWELLGKNLLLNGSAFSAEEKNNIKRIENEFFRKKNYQAIFIPKSEIIILKRLAERGDFEDYIYVSHASMEIDNVSYPTIKLGIKEKKIADSSTSLHRLGIFALQDSDPSALGVGTPNYSMGLPCPPEWYPKIVSEVISAVVHRDGNESISGDTRNASVYSIDQVSIGEIESRKPVKLILPAPEQVKKYFGQYIN